MQHPSDLNHTYLHGLGRRRLSRALLDPDPEADPPIPDSQPVEIASAGQTHYVAMSRLNIPPEASHHPLGYLPIKAT